MLKTKNLITSLADIPSSWIYEHYLNLGFTLSSDFKMKSIFNPHDRNPSMFIYYCPQSREYKFKDFSTGKYGTSVGLVMELYNISSYSEALSKVINDYKTFISNNDQSSYNQVQVHFSSKYKLENYECRNWNTLDSNYWTKYNINSEILSEYNVMPLKYTVLSKVDENENKSYLTIKNQYCYGYFKENGEIYKIYQPKSESCKFFKIRDYVQGFDQLSYKNPYLLIVSSLKDIMSIKSLKIKKLDFIAPDSENSLIPKKYIELLRQKGYKICCLFDNDKAGKTAIEKYKKEYGINGNFLDMSKDISDSIRDFGSLAVLNNLIPLLKNCFAIQY